MWCDIKHESCHDRGNWILALQRSRYSYEWDENSRKVKKHHVFPKNTAFKIDQESEMGFASYRNYFHPYFSRYADMEWEDLKKERGHRVIAFLIEGREIGSSFQLGPQEILSSCHFWGPRGK